jgi:hypothetical protein
MTHSSSKLRHRSSYDLTLMYTLVWYPYRTVLRFSLLINQAATIRYIHSVTVKTTFSMKLSLLLLSLLPLFLQARHRREDTREQHERPDQQHVRRVQQAEVPIVCCTAGGEFRLVPWHFTEYSGVLSRLLIFHYFARIPINL